MTSEDVEYYYTNISLNRDTLDLYLVRTSILNALKSCLSQFKGRFLDVGCGHMVYKPFITSAPSQVTEYIGMDLQVSSIYDTQKADLVWDGKVIPLPADSIDSAMATEVFEHCPDINMVLAEIYRVLKPGGVLFFTIPFIWPLHDVPYDEYRYTPFSLERHFRKAGFSFIDLKPLGGWDASLAQMIGLWTLRRPMKAHKRNLMAVLAKPIIKYLIKNDKRPQKYIESTMITGIYGFIIK